ncbi:unnamed protein product, partial [Lampetra fluviatilis]
DVCGDTESPLSLRLRVRALEEELRRRTLGDTGGAILAMEMESENSSLRAEVEEVRQALRDQASPGTARKLLTHPQRETMTDDSEVETAREVREWTALSEDGERALAYQSLKQAH